MLRRAANSALLSLKCRNLHLSYGLQKQIRVTDDGKKTIIEGVITNEQRKVIDLEGLGDPRTRDPILRTNLKLRHTDVLILSQFLRPDGTILPRNITGLTTNRQLLIEMLIERSKRAGLLPVRVTADGRHIYHKDTGKFNVYYDSDMIGLPKLEKKKFKYKPPE